PGANHSDNPATHCSVSELPLRCPPSAYRRPARRKNTSGRTAPARTSGERSMSTKMNRGNHRNGAGTRRIRTARRMRLPVAAAVLGLTAQVALGQDSSQTLEEIQVTGSRIQQTGMSTPTPVTVVTADEIT